MNCSTGIILSVKTRSEQQVSKLKQANLKLATRVEQLEHSCLEKVKKTLLIWVYLLMVILVQGWHCWLGFLMEKCGVSWAEVAQPCPCLPGLLLLRRMMSLPLSYFFWPGCAVFLQQERTYICGNLGSHLQAVNDLNFVSYRSKKLRG